MPVDPEIRFPGESSEYRRERNRLLEAEVELRRAIERVAAQRRTLPRGGSVPEDVVDVDTDPAEVTALDNTFDDEAIRVRAGTTVRWTNRGRQDHDIAPAEGQDWGADVGDFAPGAVYEHTFDRPGTYSYYCTIHGTAARGMVGVVVVD